MRSICPIVFTCILALLTTTVFAQDEMNGNDDPGDIFAKPESGDGAEKADGETDAPKKSSPGSSETVIDVESVNREDASGQLIDADFLSLGGTAAWLDRNGLGAHVGVGGITCAREYCNTTLDVSILGSIAGTFGAFYKLNPNWSLFADITLARLNTNFRDTSTGGYTVADNNHGFVFAFLLGPAFHLPVKGWLDLYTNIGLGPIILKETISSDESHKWGGIDIQWGLGADFYFWSVGVLKNFAIGPYMNFGFPIWVKVCDLAGGLEDCRKPSDLDDATGGNYFFDEKPITFQLGIEAKFHFGLGAKKAAPVVDVKADSKPANEDVVTPAGETSDAQKSESDSKDDNAEKAESDADAKADAEAGGEANWDM